MLYYPLPLLVYKETVNTWPWKCKHNLNQSEIDAQNEIEQPREVRKRYKWIFPDRQNGIEQVGCLRGNGMVLLVMMVNF